MQPQMELDQPQEISITTPAPAPAPQARWSLALRTGFRLAFCYFVLYSLPFPFGNLPYTDKLAEWYELLWQKLVPWTAQHILHISQPVALTFTGSGDTTYFYVRTLCLLVLALAATIVWSMLDRSRENYQKLHQWLRLYLRLILGSTLLGYGAYKVIPSQFPPMWQWRYLEAYGDSSSMGFLWTFMSASKSYTIFAGSVEMLGGILLFMPRLATLGALVSIGAMTNVFVLNMSYDVPVKLYSLHLLLLSVFLVLPELRRLARFFILNRATEPAPVELHFRRKWIGRSLLAVQLLLGLFFAGSSFYGSYQQLKNFTETARMKAPLYGAWAVEEFVADGQPRPPLVTDELRWQKVVLENVNIFTAQGMKGQILRMNAKMDFANKSIALTLRTDPKWKGNLTYELPSPDNMIMDGQLSEQKVHMRLHRTDSKYLLNTRGFHWINEFPFNR